MVRPEHAHDRIAALSSGLGGTKGVAARNLASQASVCVSADELFPMASCFKIPVMVVYLKGLTRPATERLSQALADIAAGPYEHLGEPA